MANLLDKLKASSEWSNVDKSLEDFVGSVSLPTLAKIKKGEYSSVGASKRLENVVYIHSVYSSQCVVAESQIQGRKKSIFAIPWTYRGWFEILSEDRKPIKPISNTSELLNLDTELVLVREHTKVVTSDRNDEHSSQHRPTDLEVGEVLRLDKKQNNFAKQHKLLTFRDINNKCVMLESGQKMVCSPIFQKGEIGGVCSLQNLVTNFRLPVTVQLVYGEFFSSTKFHPMFRLIGINEIKFAIVIPLKTDWQVLSIPLSELLVLNPVRDIKLYKTTEDFIKIEKFACSVEKIQQKTMSMLTSGNVKTFKKDFSKNTDNRSSALKESDHLYYEEIDEIYRYIREGGDTPILLLEDYDETSLDNSKSPETSQSPQSDQHRKNSFAAEREIWDEPIYADISKLKAQKKMRKKDVEHDSQLANLGTETDEKEEKHPGKISKNTFKKFMGNIFSSDQQSKIRDDALPDFVDVQTAKLTSPLISTINSKTLINNFREQINKTKNEVDHPVKPPQATISKKSQNDLATKISPADSKTKIQKTLQTSEHQPPNIVSDLKGVSTLALNSNASKKEIFSPKGSSSHKNNQKKSTEEVETDVSKHVEKKIDSGEGWNVFVVRDSKEDSQSKKTRVKINYEPNEETSHSDQVMSNFTVHQNSSESDIFASENPKLYRNLENSPNDDFLHNEKVRPSVNSAKYFSPKILTPAHESSTVKNDGNIHQRATKITVAANMIDESNAYDKSSPIIQSQEYVPESSAQSPSFFYEQNTSQIRQGTNKNMDLNSQNISSIQLKDVRNSAERYDNDEEQSSLQQSNPHQNHTNTIKISHHKSTEYPCATYSSKTFLKSKSGTPSYDDESLKISQQSSVAFNGDAKNDLNPSLGVLANVTMIRIDKKGAPQSSHPGGNSVTEKRHEIQKSAFGSTQVYIKQTSPSSQQNSSATKVFVNAT